MDRFSMWTLGLSALGLVVLACSADAARIGSNQTVEASAGASGTGGGVAPEDVDLCGDGVIERDEWCDDGNDVEDDYCTNRCTLNECGDAVAQSGEECDDGNSSDTDACTTH